MENNDGVLVAHGEEGQGGAAGAGTGSYNRLSLLDYLLAPPGSAPANGSYIQLSERSPLFEYILTHPVPANDGVRQIPFGVIIDEMHFRVMGGGRDLWEELLELEQIQGWKRQILLANGHLFWGWVLFWTHFLQFVAALLFPTFQPEHLEKMCTLLGIFMTVVLTISGFWMFKKFLFSLNFANYFA